MNEKTFDQLVKELDYNKGGWHILNAKVKELLLKLKKSIFSDAEADGKVYGRKDNEWVEVNESSGGIETVTGTLVDNTDPNNPVINTPVKKTLKEVVVDSPVNNFIDNNNTEIFLTNGEPLIDPNNSVYITLKNDGLRIKGLNTSNTKILTANPLSTQDSSWILPNEGGVLTVFNTNVPLTSTSLGVKGQVCFTTTHAYFCIDTNTWRKVALTTV